MNRLLAIAAICLIACVIAAILAPVEMARAWLVMALTALAFPLGALIILMIGNLGGGRWIEVLRPWLLGLAGTLPLALAAFLPLFVDLRALFPWIADPAHLSATARNKLAYLNATGLGLRFLACAALWLGLSYALGVWHGGRVRFGTAATVSGLGLGLHALLFTVFATDWMQALEPDFYSTIYPMLVASEQIVLALGAAMLLAHRQDLRPGGEPRSTVGEDVGKLLVSAVFFWAYLAFMQWVVIWSGDLPDEIGWYLPRINGAWQAVLWVAVSLGLAVPFIGLLSRRGQRNPRWLTGIIIATLLGQVIEGVWRIAPAFPASVLMLALEIPAALALGGVGLAMAEWLKSREVQSRGSADAATR